VVSSICDDNRCTIPDSEGKAAIVLKRGEFGSAGRIVVFDRMFNGEVVEEEEIGE
jgi:hypothetical protein